MSYNEILERVIDIFSTMAETDDEITAESEIIEDLGISSMDVLLLICNLEEEFGIKIPERMVRKMASIDDVARIVEDLTNK